MSKENAVLFLREMSGNRDLIGRLMDGEATSAAWVAEAIDAGYEVTADELRSVCEELAGKPLPEEEVVGELRSMFEGAGELSEQHLEAVAGGARRAAIVDRLQGLSNVRTLYVKMDMDWSNDPKHFNVGNIDLGNLGNLGGGVFDPGNF